MTKEAIEKTSLQREEEKILRSRTSLFPSGCGKTAVHASCGALPKFGEANRWEIAELVGVVPLNRDSGNTTESRTSVGEICVW